MRGWRAALLVLAAALAIGAPAAADSPRSDQRPMPRPVAETGPDVGRMAQTFAPALPTRPMPRTAPTRAGTEVISTSGIIRSPRPEGRPLNLRQRHTTLVAGIRTQPSPQTIIGRQGSLCSNRQIEGVRLAPIAGRIQGCGLDAPVKVSSVSGVRLSQAAVMDCKTAEALNTWVTTGVIPAVGRTGGGVAALNVAAHYSCRTRNNQKGAKISEHGRGRAIDISGIVLNDGTLISVLKGWRTESHGAILRAAHRAACGTFGTVLGPASDRFHQDHLHLDTARYRSGSYCR